MVSTYALYTGAAITAAVIGGGTIAMVVAAFLGTGLLQSGKQDASDDAPPSQAPPAIILVELTAVPLPVLSGGDRTTLLKGLVERFGSSDARSCGPFPHYRRFSFPVNQNASTGSTIPAMMNNGGPP